MSQEPDDGPCQCATPPHRDLGRASLVVLVWLVVGALGGAAQGKLAGVQSNDNSTFLPKSAESTLVSNAVATFIDSDTLPYLVVVERERRRRADPAGPPGRRRRSPQGVPGLRAARDG